MVQVPDDQEALVKAYQAALMKLHDSAAEDVRKKTLKDKEEADRQAQLKLQHEQDLKDKEDAEQQQAQLKN
jgi:hypothetical protein